MPLEVTNLETRGIPRENGRTRNVYHHRISRCTECGNLFAWGYTTSNAPLRGTVCQHVFPRNEPYDFSSAGGRNYLASYGILGVDYEIVEIEGIQPPRLPGVYRRPTEDYSRYLPGRCYCNACGGREGTRNRSSREQVVVVDLWEEDEDEDD